MPVLVAYATKHGSTQGIAERIAATLRAGRLDVDLEQVTAAVDPACYEAFVIGSAVYAFRWMKPASESSSTTRRCWPPGRHGCSASARWAARSRFRRSCHRPWPA